MKKLKAKIVDTLKNNNGEMLIETIISIMLFVVLIIGVTTMITAATNGIRTTRRETQQAQDAANNMVARTITTSQSVEISATLEVTSEPDPSINAKTSLHDGILYSEEGLIYFYTTP